MARAAKKGARRGAAAAIQIPFPLQRPCGYEVARQARPNVVLAGGEFAMTTYAVVSAGVAAAATVVNAYWGPSDTILDTLPGPSGAPYSLLGGVVFRNCRRGE